MTTWTTANLRPLSEGANIESWIGFKHFSYLAEAGIQEYLRNTGRSQDAILRAGHSVDIASLSLRLPSPLYADSLVDVHVEGERRETDSLSEMLCVEGLSRDSGERRRCLQGTAMLNQHRLADLEDCLARIEKQGQAKIPRARADAPGHHDWHFTVPYPFCRAASVLQFDGYVRLVEDGIERYLRAHGISVRRLLVERGWIPVVTDWKINIHEPVFMEETLLIRMDVTSIFKGLLWETRISFVAMRDDKETTVAESFIRHGYAVTKGPGAGTMATFDKEVRHALGSGE